MMVEDVVEWASWHGHGIDYNRYLSITVAGVNEILTWDPMSPAR